MKNRILFITQNLARTGSEVLLWYLLNSLDPARYAISVFCHSRGELVDLLPGHVEQNILYKNSPRLLDRVFRRIIRFFGQDPFSFQLRAIHRNFRPDIWYVNTIAHSDVYKTGHALNARIVTHVHELLNAFSLVSQKGMESIIDHSATCIACSEVVFETLKKLGHPDIRLQYSFIDADRITTDQARINGIKERLGIGQEDFVWALSGGANYMKGLDYVLPILENFKDTAIKILWLGARFDNGLDFYVKTVADLKYPGRLIFAGVQSDDYYNYLSAANGFLLLSREESFSMVLVEAAYLKIPIVAFNVGIARQFVEQGMGFVVDEGAVGELIKAMDVIVRGRANIDGEMLRKKAGEYSLSVQLPKFEKLLAGLCV